MITPLGHILKMILKKFAGIDCFVYEQPGNEFQIRGLNHEAAAIFDIMIELGFEAKGSEKGYHEGITVQTFTLSYGGN